MAPAKSNTQDLAHAAIWQRTRLLVETLLTVMESHMHAEEPNDQWKLLFGTKDSAVVNLQRMVKLLAELQALSGDNHAAANLVPIDAQEMELLAQWVRETNARRDDREGAASTPDAGAEAH